MAADPDGRASAVGIPSAMTKTAAANRLDAELQALKNKDVADGVANPVRPGISAGDANRPGGIPTQTCPELADGAWERDHEGRE